MSELTFCPDCGQTIPDRDTQKVIDALPPGAYVFATEYHVEDESVRKVLLQVTEMPAVVEGTLLGELAELHREIKRTNSLLDDCHPGLMSWNEMLLQRLKTLRGVLAKLGVPDEAR